MKSFFDNLALCGFSSVNELYKKAIPELNLHDESMVMLSGALTIYMVADLRALARKGKATVGIEELQPPITINKILELIKANTRNLVDSGDYDNELEGRIAALENLTRHSNSMLSNVVGKKTRLVEFVDKNDQNELVHAITVNDAQMRITVIFRGSVTKTDFITDAKVAQTRVDNPVHLIDLDTPETLNLHFGFHEYLFKKKCPFNSTKSRISAILDKVHSLLADNPGYSLYTCGHSLGGALCTLFGFYAAAHEQTHRLLKEPVRIVSIASPYVGNVKFLLAFQSLERSGKLQHLRIANAEDVVTLMPVVGPRIGIVSPMLAMTTGVANVYKHCGLKLQMKRKEYENGKIYRFSYPQDQSTDESYANEITMLMEDGKNFVLSLKKVVKNEAKIVAGYHSCEEYERRLNIIKNDIGSKTLSALYKDKSIVGLVLDAGYKPVILTTTTQEHFTRISGSETIKKSILGRLK